MARTTTGAASSIGSSCPRRTAAGVPTSGPQTFGGSASITADATSHARNSCTVVGGCPQTRDHQVLEGFLGALPILSGFPAKATQGRHCAAEPPMCFTETPPGLRLHAPPLFDLVVRLVHLGGRLLEVRVSLLSLSPDDFQQRGVLVHLPAGPSELPHVAPHLDGATRGRDPIR